MSDQDDVFAGKFRTGSPSVMKPMLLSLSRSGMVRWKICMPESIPSFWMIRR
ncbi:hypothetical protein SH668x_002232 [Planctomicrobium sp. SH668]|uniref:hypothetical protein n=1 Tax=Planctomicrobium sp. SH668 TaxID=3448126 RepID=UPI003F5C2645